MSISKGYDLSASNQDKSPIIIYIYIYIGNLDIEYIYMYINDIKLFLYNT
jgi:hypothetical protein